MTPGLSEMDNEDVTALIVFNGPYNLKRPAEWNLDAFVKHKRGGAAAAAGAAAIAAGAQ